MPLNIISNFAANVAHRNLSMSDRGASGSVAKISAGTRVLAARDDAAALAIGSRLRAEVAAMQQASVNAGQAVSMLQIADGAMAQVNDTLVRMQALAVQAGSDQLGSTERSLIDSEFQQLLLEVDRIAADTEFNGQSLINGGTLFNLVQASDAGTDGFSKVAFDSSVTNASVFQYSYASATETLTVTKTAVDGATVNTATDIETNQQANNNLSVALADGTDANDLFSYSYESTGQLLTVTNLRTAETSTVDITNDFNAAFGSSTNVIASGGTLAVDFASLGVTVTLDDGFDRTADLAQIDATGGTMLASAETFTLGTSQTSATLNTFLNTTIGAGNGYDAATGILTLAATGSNANNRVNIDAIAGVDFGAGAGNASGNLADNAAVSVTISDANGVAFGTFTATMGVAADGAVTVVIDLGGLVRNVQTNTSGSDETVQIDLTDELNAVAGTGENLSFNETLDVSVDQFGVTLTLDKGFDRTSDITTTTGAVTDNSASVSATSFTATAGVLTADVYDALLGLGFNSTTGIGYNANTGILTLGTTENTAGGGSVVLDGLTGLRYDNGVSGEASSNVENGTNTIALGIVTAGGTTVDLGDYTGTFVNAAANQTGTVGIQLGRGVFYNQVNANANTTDFTFKIGTGQATQDQITLSLNSVTTQALGINGTDTTTSATADSAASAISSGITTLNRARANIGAFQNRLEIAVSNLATATENTEAARSSLLDLDVAKEMTTFTSKQILVQAGVSMLAQANQLPQNLLRLLQ